MRGRAATVLILAATLTMAFAPGCRTSTRSGLPGHIKSVEVHVFKNKTMTLDLEGKLTRAVIDAVNADPAVRVASRGDAVLTGEITRYSRRTLRDTTTDELGTVQLVVEASFSLYDAREGVYLVDEAKLSSLDLELSLGVYEYNLGEPEAVAQNRLLRELGREIVRRSIGRW
ncbi:MAG: LPS assembly lipoprotein LptE [Planctomycetota bacterium]|jgi:hypothetical protein|nr:LPS assembly lipoprotein LptE [Planctomycetota bacterium]